MGRGLSHMLSLMQHPVQIILFYRSITQSTDWVILAAIVGLINTVRFRANRSQVRAVLLAGIRVETMAAAARETPASPLKRKLMPKKARVGEIKSPTCCSKPNCTISRPGGVRWPVRHVTVCRGSF